MTIPTPSTLQPNSAYYTRVCHALPCLSTLVHVLSLCWNEPSLSGESQIRTQPQSSPSLLLLRHAAFYLVSISTEPPPTSPILAIGTVSSCPVVSISAYETCIQVKGSFCNYSFYFPLLLFLPLLQPASAPTGSSLTSDSKSEIKCATGLLTKSEQWLEDLSW